VAERHPLGWAAIGLAAIGVVVSCVLPAFELAIEGFIGAGSEQRGFRYTSELTLAGDLRPGGLLPLAAALALVAAAVAGMALGSRWWLVFGSLAVACSLGVLVLDTEERLDWPEGGVIGYDEPSGGPLLQQGVDELQARARRSPEAQEPGWELLAENGYAARGRIGWTVLRWSALALFWLTAFRLARLRLGVAWSVVIVAAVSLAIAAWLFFRALSRLE
jgi:hypothetical protein